MSRNEREPKSGTGTFSQHGMRRNELRGGGSRKGAGADAMRGVRWEGFRVDGANRGAEHAWHAPFHCRPSPCSAAFSCEIL